MGMQEDIELAGLSEEEIEALKDEDGEIPPDDSDTDDDGDGELDLENNADDMADDNSVDKVEPQKGEDGPANETGEKEIDKEVTPSTSEPSFNLKTDGKAAEINQQLTELKQKFDDGDIDFEEFLSHRDDLKSQLLKAEMYEDINSQVRQSHWEAAKQSFVNQNPEIMGYSSRAAGYAAILQGLIQSEDGQKMNDAEILDAAREKFYEENPQIAPRQQEKAVGKDNLRSSVDKLKAGQKRQVRTLANIPVADANDTGNSEFAHLDNLPPEKLEKALERMSGAEMERYLEAP